MKTSRWFTFTIPALGAALVVGAIDCSTPSVPKLEPTIELSDCAQKMGVAVAQCGKVEVFEDRESRSGRTISLNVVVLPALKSNSKPDPFFFLAGGPGMGATDLVKGIRKVFKKLNHERDIVLVDQRGTGSSNPLNCEKDLDFAARFEVQPDLGFLRACADSLAANANLKLYTTPIAMDDLDEVRVALGYEKINLYGGSYGTRAGLEYMRRHGEQVRSAVLDGVAPTDMAIPEHFGEDSQRALDKMFADCQRDPNCNKTFPELEAKFYELLDRLEGDPEEVSLADPYSGEVTTAVMQREIVATLIRAVLYNSELTSLCMV